MKTNLRKLFWFIPSPSAQCAWSGRAISVIALAIVVALVVPALRLPGVQGQAQITEAHTALPDFDSRVGKSEPTSAQLAQVASLGAQVKWNRFGTPQSLIKYGGFLATGLASDPVVAARNWIRTNRTLFRLSDQGVTNLELVNDSPMVGSQGHAIIFRQRFGNLPATHDAMITVGVTGGRVAYASSSLPGDAAAPGQATLSAVEAWLIAAANVNRSATLAQVSNIIQQFTWTTFTVFGFSHPQRSRLVAFPTYTQGVRPAYETIVLDVQNGNALAYTVFVDAQTGAVLFRRNAVQQLAKYTRRAVGPAAKDSLRSCDQRFHRHISRRPGYASLRPASLLHRPGRHGFDSSSRLAGRHHQRHHAQALLQQWREQYARSFRRHGNQSGGDQLRARRAPARHLQSGSLPIRHSDGATDTALQLRGHVHDQRRADAFVPVSAQVEIIPGQPGARSFQHRHAPVVVLGYGARHAARAYSRLPIPTQEHRRARAVGSRHHDQHAELYYRRQ